MLYAHTDTSVRGAPVFNAEQKHSVCLGASFLTVKGVPQFFKKGVCNVL